MKSNETLVEAAMAEYATIHEQYQYDAFIKGAKWKSERMYSFDELRTIAYKAYCLGQLDNPTENKFNEWINKNKK